MQQAIGLLAGCQSMINLVVEQDIPKTRLDVFVVSQIPEVSRGFVQRLITEGKVTINKEPARSNYLLRRRFSYN